MIGVAALALLSALAFLRAPKHTLLALPIVFVFQAVAVAIVGGRDSTIGAVLQNADEASLMAVLVTIIAVALLARQPLRISRWVYWYGLFLVAAFLSIAVQDSGWVKGAVGLFLLSKGFIYAFAVEQLDWDSSDIEKWFRIVLGALAVVLFFALPDLIAPEMFRGAIGFETLVDYRNGLPSVMSLAGHPGAFGWLMGLGVLVALAHLIGESDPRWRKWVILFMIGVAMSLRRKPLLGIAAAVVIVFPIYGSPAMRRRARSALIVLALLAVPMLVVFFPIFAKGAGEYVNTDALTTQARSALYAGAVVLARQHFPLGVGIGRYGSYGSIVDYSDIYYQFGFNLIFGMSPTYSKFIQDTFWPQIAGETGVLGLIGYAGAVFSLLVSAWKAVRRDGSGKSQPLYLAALLIALEVLVESVAAPSYTVPEQACFSLGLLSLAATVAASRTSTADARIDV